MKHIRTTERDDDWKVLGGTECSQGAIMVLKRGKSEGGPDNRHEEADQWLFVVSGKGKATIEGTDVDLEPGSLVLIEAGERHEISNTGDEPLRTINVYAPPEY
ncbi:MAG: cupin domain-containing protein [Gemmatimonadetes bacterium]|nr:cupin domain-containing protein [Gemmatimonadota bacterium]